jgi:hypothetical protein
MEFIVNTQHAAAVTLTSIGFTNVAAFTSSDRRAWRFLGSAFQRP